MKGMLVFPPGILVDDEPLSYGRLSDRGLLREFWRRLVRQ